MSWKCAAAGVLGAGLNVFGEPVTYIPAAAPSFSITGVFSNANTEVSPGTSVMVQSSTPTLGVRLSDLGAVKPGSGDMVTVRNVNYSVVECQPDGEGGTKLILRLV